MSDPAGPDMGPRALGPGQPKAGQPCSGHLTLNSSQASPGLWPGPPTSRRLARSSGSGPPSLGPGWLSLGHLPGPSQVLWAWVTCQAQPRPPAWAACQAQRA
eukprot:NODE_8149_length_530_cov_13.091476_g7096_i0.p1 GENE.NODE_8149_length_530_cov_13.091476_g7096_i0~~NODE_8149_length_530_cov_13.091476_g7096_i0.p1  ORF type:complete len:102 (-),score=5.70 NODE_8149_length_530_cov_13.091476_g7096_i0:9-314(-)